jgi:CheY-like chemotaxis protein
MGFIEPDGLALRVVRIVLIHWDAEERRVRAKTLAALGYDVDDRPFGAESLRSIKQVPPSAFIIDLTRAPGQGRDAAMALRQTRALCRVPLIFAGGATEKVVNIKRQLPDAAYVSWSDIDQALLAALSGPRVEAERRSAFDGYAGRPLADKLGIRGGTMVVLLGAPEGFEADLGPLPRGATITRIPTNHLALVLWFVKSRAELQEGLDDRARDLNMKRLWIIWPKKGSTLSSDLTQEAVRKEALARGLIDFKIASIGSEWTGLQFSRRFSPAIGR